MPQPDQSNAGWIMGGRFSIEAATREEAERAMEAIERAAKRAPGSTNFAIHINDVAPDQRQQ